MALNIDEVKKRVAQPSSRLAPQSTKVEEPESPAQTSATSAKRNSLVSFTRAAGEKKGISTRIADAADKEYRPGDLRKAMFAKARTYYSMPDELKPIAQQGFVKAYSAYESAKSDPMSPLYNPYSRPTNYKAIEGLAQYGYDVTKMTEDEIRALTAYRRTTATGYGAAAPTKSSSAAENAAYWAQEYLDASERTAAAESELAAMQKAVDYYVNTLGLSDAEIVQRINASKDYPTLAKMRETSVTPQLMNRAIDYSGDDTVYGMIFSARNGGASMGSNDMNAGAYMGGFGNRYEDDGGVARRNAGDLNTYNPYAGGTTLEALGLKYGTGSFTAEWLAENRDRLAVEAPDDLKKIDAAIATSAEAEKEYAALQEWAQKRIAAGDTPEEIKEKLDEELGDKDYSTLAKMEEGRRTGNPIAMGYGVGFARSEFERYIDSLYAEANAEQVSEPTFTVSSYYERGGDGNILNNEVSNWLTGRAPTTEEGKAFIEEYGWLLSGYTQDRGTETLYDRRLAERPGLFGKATGLGETAHDLLVEAQEAADNRWLSPEDYVTVAISVAENMEAAEAAGMSLEDYLSSGMGTLPDISDAIEQGRAEVEKRDADRKAMEAMQIQQSIEEADAAVANGTATAEQASLAESLDSMNVAEAEAMSPAIAEQRSAIRTELQEYSRSAIVGNLETVYGDMSTYGGSEREMEAADNARSVAYNTADNIADIALSYYNADANRAAVMGIDLDEYYALYPERRMSTEEAYKRAQTDYNTKWGAVWANIERQANLARQGQMVIPQQSLADVVSGSEQADAAYDASKAPVVEYGEGVGVGQTIRSSLAGGGLEAAGGTISAIQYFVTSNNDYMAESAARMGFNNDPVAYRKYLEETVAAIADPEQRESYEYLLKNYEGDVFNITLDTYDIAASNALYRIQQESMEIDQFMKENGTAGENAAFNYGKNAVSSTIYWAETAALTAVGLPGGVAAAVAFGAPAGADMGRKLEAAGMDTNAAKGAALGWVAITGWLEASTMGNYFPGLAEKAGTSLVKQGLSAAFKRNPKILSNVLNWIVPSMASEAAQEGVEYLAGTAYESVFTTAAGGGGSFVEYVGQVVQDVEGDELLDSMKMGALMAPVLGVVGLGASATAKATTAVAGRIPGKRRSQEIAEQIIDNGGATAEQAMEFAEALDEDMKDPEFAAEMQAAAREAQISEYVAQEVMSGALAEDTAEPAPQTGSQPSGRRAKRDAKREYRKHDVFVQQVERARADLAKVQTSKAEYATLYQDAMREYDADPSDAAMQKMVMELTTELASLNEQERAATERVTAEEAKLRDYEAELGETRLARLEEARRNAIQRVNAEEAQARAEKRAETQPEETQAEQPEPVYNEETAPEQPVEQTEAQPEPVAEVPVEKPAQPSVGRAALDAQAKKLQKAFAKYARGKRISQKGTFSRSGKLPLELGLLEDAGLLTVQGKAALDAYANGDTEYVAEHAEYIARRLEPVLTMLAEEAKAAEDAARAEAEAEKAKKEAEKQERLKAVEAARAQEESDSKLRMHFAQQIKVFAAEYTQNRKADRNGKWTEEIPNELQGAADAGLLSRRGLEALDAYISGDADAIAAHKRLVTRWETYLQSEAEYANREAEAMREEAALETGKVLYYHESPAANEAALASGMKGGKIESPVRVANELYKALGIAKYTVPHGTEAQYDRVASLVRIDGLHNSDYLRTLHEAGHALSDKIGMTATPIMVASKLFGGNRQEAFAGFFAAYMFNKRTATMYAGPDFVDEFELKLKEHNFYKAVTKARMQVEMYASATEDDRIAASIVNRSDIKPGKSQLWRKFRTNFTNVPYAGKLVDRMAGNPEYGLEAALRYKPSMENMADVIWSTRMVDPYGMPIGKSWADIMEDHGVHTEEHARRITRLMLKVHGISRAEQNKPVFAASPEALHMEWVNASENDRDCVRELAQAWRTFTRAWLVDTGHMTEEAYNELFRMYPFYVPTLRDVNGEHVDASMEQTGSGWHIREAKGSDLDVIEPLDTIPEMIRNVVTYVAHAETGRLFDKLYNSPEAKNMGLIAEMVELPAEGKDSKGDVFLDNTRMPDMKGDVLVVTREDGTRVAYRFNDSLTYNVLTASGSRAVNALVRGLQRVTNGMQRLTTGNNPIWGPKNFVADTQSSSLQGKHAATVVDLMPKWFSTLPQTVRGRGEAYDMYINMGGGASGRSDTFSAKGRRQLRKELLGNRYKAERLSDNLANFAADAFNAITLDKLNQILEQNTRVTAFRYGTRDTVEHTRLAFLDSQYGTLDFIQKGGSPAIATLRAAFPFFNSSVQGVAQALDTIEGLFDPNASPAERKNAQRVATKTVVHAALAGAFMRLLYSSFSDEEKEEFAKLAGSMKVTNLYLPTRWLTGDDIEPERMFIRIPLNKNILFQLCYAGVFDATEDPSTASDLDLDFLTVASDLVLDAMPIDISGFFESNPANGLMTMANSTIVGPYLGVALNRNWYNGTIVPPYMVDLKFETQQYTNETPSLFVAASEALYRTTGKAISPMALQYIAEQQTGFVGQILIPFLSRNSVTGEWSAKEGLGNVGRSVRNTWTLDARSTNDIVDSYYDIGKWLGDIVGTDDSTESLPHTVPNADRDEAYSVAEDLLETYEDTQKQVKAITTELNEVYADESLSDAERTERTNELKAERRDIMRDFNLQFAQEYSQIYGGDTIWDGYAKYVADLMTP